MLKGQELLERKGVTLRNAYRASIRVPGDW